MTGAEPAQFYKPTLKRHSPQTVRKSVGDSYHGCLRIDVLQSAGLYRRIEGWVRAAVIDAVEDVPGRQQRFSRDGPDC